MGDPASVDHWLMLARQHEVTARLAADSKEACAQALFHCGIGLECVLKAYIMHKERLNSWPSKAAREELYTHDIRKLMAIAGLTIAATQPQAAGWLVMQQWDRNQAYDPKRMPRRVARAYVEACFGKEGVATWIKSSFLKRT
jgi:hypothetical protein